MLSINKEDITQQIMSILNFPRDKTISYINTLLDLIADGLITHKRINVQGLGTFKLIEKKSRIGRNPATGKSYLIEARESVSFSMYYKARESMRLQNKLTKK
jgi:integration host factor subunit alpha